jgi:hypothetical protein
LCIHIESTTLSDGIYDLVPESESEQREAQVKLMEVTEDPNQSSEEPPTSFSQEGKPRASSQYLINVITVPFLSVHLCS